MIITRLILTLMLPLFLGYCILALIYNKKKASFIESFSLAWGIGLGILGLEMFSLSRLGILLKLQNIVIVTTLLLIPLILFIIINKINIFDFLAIKKLILAPLETKHQENKWLLFAEKSLICLIALKILLVFFEAIGKPLLIYDALWRHGSIAKIIFVTGEIFGKQSGHLEHLAGYYPFLNPLAQVWIYLGIGSWNDALGKIVFALCFTALVFLFYANLRKYTSRLYALLFTFFLSSLPLIVYHAGTGYADLMQTFYYSTAAIYLFNWINKQEKSSLYLSALFFGLANFVKRTGIVFWIIATLVLVIYLLVEKKKEAKSARNFILISILVSAPWLFFKKSFLMLQLSGLWAKFSSFFSGAASEVGKSLVTEHLQYGSPTIANIIFHLSRRMFTYADWLILWFTFIIVAILGWKQILESKIKYLFLIIILNFGVIIYAFNDSEVFRFLVDGTLVKRLMMYTIPTVLFFIALSIHQLLTIKDQDK